MANAISPLFSFEVEKIPLLIQQSIGRFFHGDILVQKCVHEEIVYKLSTYILGLQAEKIVWHVSYPQDWWEALKERFAPSWLRKRYPVKYTERHFEERKYAKVCPHLTCDPEKDHVRFFYTEKIEVEE